MLTLNDGRNELWQWDTNRKLTVDADCSQVHFSNKVFGRSIDVDVIEGTATIPDVLLQTDKELTAWAFAGTDENGYTKIEKTFKVNRRNKPADYVFTPPEQTTLGQIMKRLDRIEESQDPDAIKNAVDDYLVNNPIQIDETDPTVPAWAKQATKPKYTAAEVGAVATVNGVKPDANGNVQIIIPDSGGNVELDTTLTQSGKAADAKAVGDALNKKLSADELPNAVNEALAQAKASGEFDGKDGVDGQDGYTPQKGIDYFDGKDGQPGKDGEPGKDGAPGADGKDYVLTEADKTEIAELAAGLVDVPGGGGSGGSGEVWELITEVELSEVANSVTISTDSNGNTFELKKALAFCYLVSNTSEKDKETMNIGFDVYTFKAAILRSSKYSKTVTLYTDNTMSRRLDQLYWDVDGDGQGYNGSATNKFHTAKSYPASIWSVASINVSKLMLLGNTGTDLAPGTKFKIYGVRA